MTPSNPFEVIGHHEGETSEARIPLHKIPNSKDEMSDLSPAKEPEQNNNISEESPRQVLAGIFHLLRTARCSTGLNGSDP